MRDGTRMKIHQFELWKARPLGFNTDHWFLSISGQERCDEERYPFVNGLACFTLRGVISRRDVQLDTADGLAAPTACQCDYLHPVPKSALHSSLGVVSWERQQQIKSKIKELLRL